MTLQGWDGGCVEGCCQETVYPGLRWKEKCPWGGSLSQNKVASDVTKDKGGQYKLLRRRAGVGDETPSEVHLAWKPYGKKTNTVVLGGGTFKALSATGANEAMLILVPNLESQWPNLHTRNYANIL